MNQGLAGTLYLLLSGIVPILIFCWPLKRRPSFPLRLLLGLALYAAIDLGGGQIRFTDSDIALHALFNVGKFLALCGLMWFIWQEAAETIVFSCVAGKCIMHLAEYLCTILFFSLLGYSDSQGYVPLITFGSMVITAIIYAVSWYFLGRRVRMEDCAGIDRRLTIAFTTLALLVTDVVTMWFRSLHLGDAAETLVQVLMILLCIALLWVLFGLVMENKMRHEADMLAQLRIREQEQYALSREMVQLVGVKYHDLKALLDSRGGLTEAEAAALRSEMAAAVVPFQTGNPTLDTVLTERSIACKRKGIRLECMLDADPLRFMEDMDVYSLFLNALNNAIESADQVEEEAKRVIWLRVEQTGGLARIQVRNYYRDEPVMAGGVTLTTTKEDRRYHGFGLQSMRLIAEKYGGTISVSPRDKLFTLAVALPVPNNAERRMQNA